MGPLRSFQAGMLFRTMIRWNMLVNWLKLQTELDSESGMRFGGSHRLLARRRRSRSI
ncbi:hypothetical protein D3C72_2481370 [compost metagenome]